MRYDLLIAEDNTMPPGQDWLFIRHSEGDLLVIRKSAFGQPYLLHELWAATREAFAGRQVLMDRRELRVV